MERRDMAVKRSHEEEKEVMVDRLSNMPESLQLRILSCLNARHAVRTMVLSKSWFSLWTCTPVLNFSSKGFINSRAFDKFMLDSLSHRQPVRLDRLTLNYGGKCIPKILENVFDYAFSHGVQELEANIVDTINQSHRNRSFYTYFAGTTNPTQYWPIYTSSDSLVSLKLVSSVSSGFLLLEPRSGTYKNLIKLHLHRVLINNLDPFSGFPALEKLTLVCCQVVTNGHALNVHAPQLSEFTFLDHNQIINCCEFTTPKLRYFKWEGYGFPQLKGSFPVLDTVVINWHGRKNLEKKRFDDLVMLFGALHGARSLTISAPVVHLLSLFLDDKYTSPFWDLKCLKLDCSPRHLDIESVLSYRQTLELVPGVEAYLLRNSHHANCTIINHPHADSECSSSHIFIWERKALTRRFSRLAQSRLNRVDRASRPLKRKSPGHHEEPWNLTKCQKPTHKFIVRLEISSPDSFSVKPLPVDGYSFPGEADCFQKLTHCLPIVVPSHYTQTHVGGEACVFHLKDYDAVVKALKAERIEYEDIPYVTRRAVSVLSRLLIIISKSLLEVMLPFQIEGVKFGLRRGGRCLIADEMGLGKTLQAIAITSCFMNEGPILVVCPAILRYTWAEELEHWLPSCLPSDIHLVFGHVNNPENFARSPKVVVISYTMLHHLKKSILKQKWAVLIVDESHHVRCTKRKSSEAGEV
ncbi:uncharacterized protein LOC143563109 [Bidens hawaiensis]|uniref:uncharacterized protein LOC143563109 n=1 Tax=Bidens hawaiensis TaxID=980011 RepID=UPI00404A8513